MCVLECKVVENDSHRYKAQDWIILAIMNTQCVTFRTDYLVYSISKDNIYEWRGMIGMPIQFFWCRPDINLEDLDLPTSMESKHQYLMKMRDDYFKVKGYIYDPERRRARDAKHEVDSIPLSPEELEARDRMWTPILGPRLQTTSLSTKPKINLRSKIISSKRVKVVSINVKSKLKRNPRPITRERRCIPLALPSKKVIHPKKAEANNTPFSSMSEPSLCHAPAIRALDVPSSNISKVVRANPIKVSRKQQSYANESLESRYMDFDFDEDLRRPKISASVVDKNDKGTKDSAIVKDVVMPLIDKITELTNEKLTRASTSISSEVSLRSRANEDSLDEFCKFNKIRKAIAGDIREDLCYMDQRDSNNRMALLHHDQYRHMLNNGGKFDPVTHTPHHPQQNFGVYNLSHSFETPEIRIPVPDHDLSKLTEAELPFMKTKLQLTEEKVASLEEKLQAHEHNLKTLQNKSANSSTVK